MTQDWERLGRRLAREHDKNRRAVGTRIGAATVMLWEQWTERGRARVLLVAASYVSDAADALARAVLGKDALIRAARLWDARRAYYVLPLDEGRATGEIFRRVEFKPPWSIRWFDARALGVGLGQQQGAEWVQNLRSSTRLLPAWAE